MKTTNQREQQLWPSSTNHREAVIALLVAGWYFNHATGEWTNSDATITGRLEWNDSGTAWIRRAAPPQDADTPFNLSRIPERLIITRR